MAETRASISIGAKDDTGPAFNSVQRSIQKLQVAAATAGKSAGDTKLYELAVRGASAAQLEAARSALKLSESYARGAEIGNSVKTGLLTIGAVAATAFVGAAVAFDRLIEKAGSFQDAAEKTGDTAENIASLALSAASAGTSIDAVTTFAIKLTKNLTGVDDESSKAGAAIKALGLDINALKGKTAADQLEAIAKALAKFDDKGGGKTSALEAIAKGGAELLPFFKELGEEGSRQVVLTNAQIKAADDFSDSQARLGAQISLYAQKIAIEALPLLSEFTETIRDLAKDQDIASTASDVLKGALGGAITIFQTIAVVASEVGFVFLGVGREIGAVAAQLAALARLDFRGFSAISDAVKDDAVKARAQLDKFQAKVMAIGTGGPKPEANQTPASKPKIKFNGADPKSGGGNSAASEAKAQLALDIEDIRKANESLIATYANAEKVIEAQRSANLLSDREYFDAKRGFLNLNNDAQEAALSKELARLQAEKLSGKDRIDNARKILDVQSKLDKVREASFTNLEVLRTGEKAYFKKITDGYIAAEAAARNYLDTLRTQQARETAGLGQGNIARSRSAGVNQIEDKFADQRLRLEQDRRNGAFEGREDDLRNELDLIRRSEAEALQIFTEGYDQRIEAQKNWQIGASEAFRNYYDEATNTAKQVEDAFTGAFKGLEDALVNFVKTGKLDFKSLADSIITDLIRIEVKKSVLGPLSGFLGGLTGSGGGDGGDFDALFARAISGGRAIGGPVGAGGLYRVNEKGPELLSVAGKQYLMMGDQSGDVTPNSGSSSSQPVMVTNNFTVSGPIDRRSQQQIAAAGAMGVQRALARS